MNKVVTESESKSVTAHGIFNMIGIQPNAYEKGFHLIMLGKDLSNSKLFSHKTLEERAEEFDGKLMLDGEYDWGNLSEEDNV